MIQSLVNQTFVACGIDVFDLGLSTTPTVEISVIELKAQAGIIITAGRLLNFDRYDSTKISFYLSVPAIAGASFLNLKELTFSNIEVNFITLLAVICSFIFSYITIKYFLIFVKKFSMNFFVIYRIFLGLILFWFIYT